MTKNVNKPGVLGEEFSEEGEKFSEMVSELSSPEGLKKLLTEGDKKLYILGNLLIERALRSRNVIELERLTRLGLSLISESKGNLLRETRLHMADGTCSVQNFMLQFGRFHEFKSSDLYLEYEKFCDGLALEPVGRQKFLRDLVGMGFERLVTRHSRKEPGMRVIRATRESENALRKLER